MKFAVFIAGTLLALHSALAEVTPDTALLTHSPCADAITQARELEQISPGFVDLISGEEQSRLFRSTPETISALRRYQGASLSAMQDASLKQSMEYRGADVTGRSGYESLRAESAQNLKQWSETRAGSHDPALRDLAELLSKLTFVYQHNTTRYSKIGVTPIFSSRQLENLGMRGGLNTAKFNKEILRTDDNVYFFVLPILAGVTHLTPADLPTARGKYGHDMFQMDEAYAEKAAWISPFVMFPDEFHKIATAVDPSIVPLIDQLRPRGDQERFLRTINLSIRAIHKLDFTVADFRSLIQVRLYNALAELHHDNRSLFTTTISSLRAGDYKTLQSLLQIYVFYPMGLPDDRFEAKVPVAVPAENLRPLQNVMINSGK